MRCTYIGVITYRLASAEHFGGQNPSPILVDKAEDSMRKISTEKASGIAKDYLPGWFKQ